MKIWCQVKAIASFDVNSKISHYISLSYHSIPIRSITIHVIEYFCLVVMEWWKAVSVGWRMERRNIWIWINHMLIWFGFVETPSNHILLDTYVADEEPKDIHTANVTMWERRNSKKLDVLVDFTSFTIYWLIVSNRALRVCAHDNIAFDIILCSLAHRTQHTVY